MPDTEYDLVIWGSLHFFGKMTSKRITPFSSKFSAHHRTDIRFLSKQVSMSQFIIDIYEIFHLLQNNEL
jgi:hypothetical protein